MNKFFSSIFLALMVSMSATTAFAQPVLTNDNLSTTSGGQLSDSRGHSVANGDNLSTPIDGVGGGISGPMHEGAIRRAYSTDTSPCAEIVQVVRKGACTAAAHNLASLRRGTESYEFFTTSFRKEMAIADLTLEDFKTSEAELRELQIFGAKLSALQYLVQLRKGTPSYKHFLRGLREELKTGGLTPADIGSSEFELQDVRQSKN